MLESCRHVLALPYVKAIVESHVKKNLLLHVFKRKKEADNLLLFIFQVKLSPE